MKSTDKQIKQFQDILIPREMQKDALNDMFALVEMNNLSCWLLVFLS